MGILIWDQNTLVALRRIQEMVLISTVMVVIRFRRHLSVPTVTDGYHDSDGHGGYHDSDGHGGYHDSDGHGGYHDNYDWLNPGGYYSYSNWYYPSYSYYWYPSYAYTYPVAYTAPVVYPAYNYYYDPVVYDPWYATNVYGWTGSTYYYSSSWSWSRYGGYYFV